MKKKVKRKLKTKPFLILLGIVFFLCISFLFYKEIPTNHINITGNNIVKTIDIIKSIGYQNYPKLFSKSKSNMVNSLLKNSYINKVKINRNILGELNISIEEARPIFYNRDQKKLILSNGNSIEENYIYGTPVLTNYVPDNLYDRLITSFSKLSSDCISLISEIIYDPWKNGDTMIDETRFFLRMNDGNHVYINLIHFDKLNSYLEIYATLEGKKGTLYLDSSSDKISFSLF